MVKKQYRFLALLFCAFALSATLVSDATADNSHIEEAELIDDVPEVKNMPKAELAIAKNSIDLPAVSKTMNNISGSTHPVLKITPDKSEMIKLSAEAASVIVGNPNHISVLLDTPTTLVVVPRNIGASHFSVIGKNGDVIMQRHVVVGVAAAASEEQYVRIRRSCAPNDAGCQPTSVYFCPDMCHEVQENTQGRR